MYQEWQNILYQLENGKQHPDCLMELIHRSELLMIRTAVSPDMGSIEFIARFLESIPWYVLPSEAGELHLRLHLRYGRICFQMGEWDKAADIFSRALQSHHVFEFHRLAALVYMEYGELNRKRGDLQHALDCQQHALTLAREHHLILEEADAMNNMAIVCIEMGRLNEAEEYLYCCLETAQHLGDSRLQGHIHNNLGVMGSMRSRFDDAVAHFMRALPCRDLAGDIRGFSETCHNLGIVMMEQQHLNEAEEWLQKAMDCSVAIADRAQETTILLTRAELALAIRDTGYAMSLAEEILQRQQSMTDLPGIADTHRLMGKILMAQGRYPDAELMLRKSLEGFRGVNFPLGQAECLKDLGLCLQHQGRQSEAIPLFQSAQQIFRELGNTEEGEDIHPIHS